MLKKIDVNFLRRGMYIEELCSSWMDTPFWKKSFMLDDLALVEKIKTTGIREVWIDISKGFDVLTDVQTEVLVESISPTPAVDEKLTSIKEPAIAFNKITHHDHLSRAGG